MQSSYSSLPNAQSTEDYPTHFPNLQGVRQGVLHFIQSFFISLNRTSNSKWNKIVCQYLHVFSYGNDLQLKLDCPFQVVLEMSLADGLKHCYFCYIVQGNPLKVLCTLSA